MAINLQSVCQVIIYLLLFQDENGQDDKTQTQIKKLLIREASGEDQFSVLYSYTGYRRR